MKDRKYWIRLNTTIEHFNLPIDIWSVGSAAYSKYKESTTSPKPPKAGAQCGSPARWDLSGGRRVTGVPTGIIILSSEALIYFPIMPIQVSVRATKIQVYRSSLRPFLSTSAKCCSSAVFTFGQLSITAFAQSR